MTLIYTSHLRLFLLVLPKEDAIAFCKERIVSISAVLVPDATPLASAVIDLAIPANENALKKLPPLRARLRCDFLRVFPKNKTCSLQHCFQLILAETSSCQYCKHRRRKKEVRVR